MRHLTPHSVSPWAYFFPIVTAVFVGILAADLVRLAVATAAARQAQREAVVELERLTRDLDAQADAIDAQQPRARPVLPVYPAPSSISALGSLACSNGALLRRIEGGWEQVGRQPACRSSSR